MQANNNSKRRPTFYIPHGGGPCFFMDWTMGPADTWDRMRRWLVNFGSEFATAPDAIVVISAHWESSPVTVNNGSHPPMLFDYFGFPKHTYELRYPALGSPELADEIATLLSGAGVDSSMDSRRGYDHGVFIPFLLAFPAAEIPIVQVSLDSSLDPLTHLKMGRALAPLRDKNVLIVGSGLSYHNTQRLLSPPNANLESQQFDQWLSDTCKLAEPMRSKQLRQWSRAPSAREAHPREEHLLPLMVVAGAANDDPGSTVFTDRVMGATVSAFRFG